MLSANGHSCDYHDAAWAADLLSCVVEWAYSKVYAYDRWHFTLLPPALLGAWCRIRRLIPIKTSKMMVARKEATNALSYSGPVPHA